MTETLPTESTPIANTAVRVVGGPSAGKEVATDGNGSFTLDGVWGDADVSVSRPGYESRIVHVAASEAVVNVKLMPDAETVRSPFSGRLCHDRYFYYPQFANPSRLCPNAPVEQQHVVALHRGGALSVGLEWEHNEDTTRPDFMRMTITCGATQVDQWWARAYVPPAVLSDDDRDPSYGVPHYGSNLRPQPLRISVAEPSLCGVKLWAYYSFPNVSAPVSTGYQLTIDHPR